MPDCPPNGAMLACNAAVQFNAEVQGEVPARYLWGWQTWHRASFQAMVTLPCRLQAMAWEVASPGDGVELRLEGDAGEGVQQGANSGAGGGVAQQGADLGGGHVLQLLQLQPAVLQLGQQLGRQRVAELAQRVLVAPQPLLECLPHEAAPKWLGRCAGLRRAGSRALLLSMTRALPVDAANGETRGQATGLTGQKPLSESTVAA